VAATGRLSSSDPNLQNIPIRTQLGREIRKGFIAEPGHVLLAADYSQIELRILAHFSGDEPLVQAFQEGIDVHRQTAAVVFDVPVDVVTAEQRGRAKTINFATLYGQGAFALARQLDIPRDEAREFIAAYFERFSGVRRFLFPVPHRFLVLLAKLAHVRHHDVSRLQPPAISVRHGLS